MENATSDVIAGNWKMLKGKVKEKWGKLTDDDLDVIDGKMDQLVGQLQKQYGLAKEDANRELDALVRANSSSCCGSTSSCNKSGV